MSAHANASAAAIAILGGTFDPPHRGHLALARAALAAWPTAQVWLTPNGKPPHRTPPRASWAARVAMTRLAVVAESATESAAESTTAARLRVSVLESPRRRAPFCWTIDTVRRVRRIRPRAGIILLLGGDAFAAIESWREWRALFAAASFAVMRRADEAAGDCLQPAPPTLARFCEGRRATDPADAAARAGRIVCLGAGPLCSSSAIRAKLRARDCVESDLPPSVAAYATANGLYR